MHAHESEFGRSHTEVAKAEGDVIETEFSEEPGALRVGREELDDGSEVDVGLLVVHADNLGLAVGDELFGLCFGEECHVEVPCVSGRLFGPVTKTPDQKGRPQGADQHASPFERYCRAIKATDVTAALGWRGRC